MAKSTPAPVVRSSKDIKASLLRNAWMTGAAAHIISEIQLRHKRNETMPEGHKEALFHLIPDQDPALMRINLRNYLSGHTLFSAADKAIAPKVATAGMNPKRYETHEIYEQLLADQKGKAEIPAFMLQHGALLLAEDIADAAATGLPYYADDVSLSNFKIRNSGDLDYHGRLDVHEPYSDAAYQALQGADDLKPIFGEAASPVPAEPCYADDAYLAAQEAPRGAVMAPYQDDFVKAKSEGPDMEEYLRDIFGAGSEPAADPAQEQALPTRLSHEKMPLAHSPYIDAFFNAARWGKDGIETGAAQQAEEMDCRATVKPRPIFH